MDPWELAGMDPERRARVLSARADAVLAPLGLRVAPGAGPLGPFEPRPDEDGAAPVGPESLGIRVPPRVKVEAEVADEGLLDDGAAVGLGGARGGAAGPSEMVAWKGRGRGRGRGRARGRGRGRGRRGDEEDDSDGSDDMDMGMELSPARGAWGLAVCTSAHRWVVGI